MTSARNLEIRRELQKLDAENWKAWLDYRNGFIHPQQAVAIWERNNPKKAVLIDELAGLTNQGNDPLA
ncbi:MAG: hypothetical protein OS112_03305 [Methanoregula sp.]|nr:MAG: hypothetical protein OS112_03305 [Methanoregula sp.]